MIYAKCIQQSRESDQLNNYYLAFYGAVDMRPRFEALRECTYYRLYVALSRYVCAQTQIQDKSELVDW